MARTASRYARMDAGRRSGPPVGRVVAVPERGEGVRSRKHLVACWPEQGGGHVPGLALIWCAGLSRGLWVAVLVA